MCKSTTNESTPQGENLQQLHQDYTDAMLALHKSKARREAAKRDPRIFDANSNQFHSYLYREYLNARQAYLEAVERDAKRQDEGGAG